jgi:putative endonuclease
VAIAACICGVTTDARKQLGRRGEQIAARHLEAAGWHIVDRNYRVREGEIDLVAARGSTLAFCEVKTLVARDGPTRGPANPVEAVGPGKRAQIRRMARVWLAARAGEGKPARAATLRLDVIGVVVSPDGRVLKLEHLEGAM